MEESEVRTSMARLCGWGAPECGAPPATLTSTNRSPSTSLCEAARSSVSGAFTAGCPRSRRAVGVGDVAGEHGDRKAMFRRLRHRDDLDAFLAEVDPEVVWHTAIGLGRGRGHRVPRPRRGAAGLEELPRRGVRPDRGVGDRAARPRRSGLAARSSPSHRTGPAGWRWRASSLSMS